MPELHTAPALSRLCGIFFQGEVLHSPGQNLSPSEHDQEKFYLKTKTYRPPSSYLGHVIAQKAASSTLKNCCLFRSAYQVNILEVRTQTEFLYRNPVPNLCHVSLQNSKWGKTFRVRTQTSHSAVDRYLR